VVQEISDALGGVPPAAVWGLLAFAGVTLAVQIVALIDLARRDRVLWDRKWVWALIIILINNAVGAILWFVLGRRVPQDASPVEHVSDPAAGGSVDRAVELLYGEDDPTSGDETE
jgi:hypothetical protein